MMRHDSETITLPVDAAERILARAADLDARQRAEVPVARLRAAAIEAGIAPTAFDAALTEPASEAARAVSVPWWVRVCLFGMVDRRTAMACYWLFGVVLLLTPEVWLLLRRTPAAQRHPQLLFGLVAFLMAWSLFSLWSTARAIRWADRHGWEQLP